MKTHLKFLLAAAFAFQFGSADAQMGNPGGPQLNAATAKLFGDQQSFSSTMEISMNQRGEPMTLPAKIAFDHGKARIELNMSEAKGGGTAQSAAQMKAMGMDQMIMISRPDEKASYMIMPGIKAYALVPEADSGSTNLAAFKMELTRLGEETVEGQECVKNKAVVTDDQGKPHEFTVWNAKALKDFPVKIQMNQDGGAVTTVFKNIKFSKPNSSQFNPPANFTKHDNFMAMMQQEVMKRMQQQGGGMPAGE